jgi:hypothetical protein
MSRFVVLPLEFLGQQGALLEPADHKLHDMAVDYCTKELQNGQELNLSKFTKAWVVVEMDGTDYKEIHAIAGFVWRIDIPVFRSTGNHVDYTTKLLIDRMRAFFQDNGARGTEVFLHISSKERPEQRCEKWQESLDSVGAVPADRFSVKV